jgi:50S ribosomal protein L16 3-hydroxylase
MPQAQTRSFPGTISVEEFLRDYWQKKPLLVRQAFPGIRSPLSPEELAGLACEDNVNARLVLEHHEHGPWFVQHGPFDDDDFAALPESHWTLLVTDIEKHLPAATELIEPFRFIPDWRIDDLMISYAVDGGSVGPHTDAYDVFLIQAEGKRRWRISEHFDDAHIEGPELRILAGFNAEQEWVLEPGDMLYLPPNVAHYGIAVGECMTCSVGFRAPSYRDMLGEYAESIAACIDAESRYTDPDLQIQSSPGEISPQSLAAMQAELARRLVIDEQSFRRWFGEFSSENRAGLYPTAPALQLSGIENLRQLLHAHRCIHRASCSRIVFAREQDHALLFVDGECFETGAAFAECICQSYSIDSDALLQSLLSAQDNATLLALYNRGYLYPGDDERG